MFSGGGTRYQYFLNFSDDSVVQPELRTSVLEILMGMVWGVSWQWDFYSSLGDSHRQSHALMKPWAMGSNKDEGDSVHQGLLVWRERTVMSVLDGLSDLRWTQFWRPLPVPCTMCKFLFLLYKRNTNIVLVTMCPALKHYISQLLASMVNMW